MKNISLLLFGYLLVTIGFTPSYAQGPKLLEIEASKYEGRWIGYKTRPGRVESDHFVFELNILNDSINGNLFFQNITVPIEGALEDIDKSARFMASAGGKKASFELLETDGILVGNLDQWGRPFKIQAIKATPELEAVPSFSELSDVQVDFPIQYPNDVSKNGLNPSQEKEMNNLILDLMKKERIVGLSTAIIRDGKIVDIRNYGWEDYHNQIPASEKTMYRWASVSKPLTALAALMLSEDGALNLEEDIRSYVPEWPEQNAVITTSQILKHQSGIVHYDEMKPRSFKKYDVEHPWTDGITALDMFSESNLQFKPGTEFRYSTPAYVLLGAVIERTAKMSYVNFVENRICKPLGMKTMRPDRIWETIEHRAAGYGQKNQESPVFLGNLDDISWKTPAGGWISNVNDFALFAKGLMSSKLISKGTQQAMWKPTILEDGSSTGFGLGIQVENIDRGTLIYHSGSQLGTSTHFACLPEEHTGVVIMCNKEGAVLVQLAQEILKMSK